MCSSITSVEPSISEYVCGGASITLLDSQHVVQQPLQSQTHVDSHSEDTTLDGLEQFTIILASEGKLPIQQHVQQHTQRPHIHWLALVLLLRHDFGCHVAWRPTKYVQFGVLVDRDGKPKIDHLDALLPIYEDVLQLDIAVHDILSVAVVDGLHDLLELATRIILRHLARLELLQVRAQGQRSRVLHH